ncbi:unnamed protein product [Diamesa tonsa]
MKNSLALTLLIVVLANNVNCDRLPPVRGAPSRPPVNNPGVVIPTRPNKVQPTRQTMTISRTPPTRPAPTTKAGQVTNPTRAPVTTTTKRVVTNPTRSVTNPTRATSGPVTNPTRPAPTVTQSVPMPTTTRQKIDLTTTTVAPVPTAPQPPTVVTVIPTAPVDNRPVSPLPPVNTLPTPLPPRVGPSFPDPRCPLGSGLSNPVQLPHQSDCNRFYKCDHGIAFEYRCPSGQHWNVARNYCDFPNLAGCSVNGNVQLPTDVNNPISIPMAPSNPSSAQGYPDQRCPHTPTQLNPLGDVNIAHPNSCSKYLRCVQGLAYQQSCPNGQHFNTARAICDMPQLANCQLGRM